MSTPMIHRFEPTREAQGPAHGCPPGTATEEPAKRPRWARWLIRATLSVAFIVAIIVGALGLRQHLVSTRPAPPVTTVPERIRTVDITKAVVQDVQPTLTLYGQVAAGRTVDLRLLVGGEVTRIAENLVEGGKVARDAPLVTVDRFEYEGALVRARTELAEAEARIAETEAKVALERAAQKRAVEQREIAGREVDRLATLLGRGATSDATLDASRSRLAGAESAVELRANQIRVLEAQLDRERASLDRLRWNVQKAERDIRNTTLFAPYEGLLSNVAAEVGRLVNVNDRVATLVDLDRFEVRFSLSDAQYGRLVAGGRRLEGQAVEVEWHGGGSVLQAKGVIDRISPVVAAATGGFDVFARLERSPATEKMRPGAFVTVRTADVVYDDVVRLPQSAVHPGSRIFAVGDDNRLIEIPVTVAGFDGDARLVRGEVKEGMRIMASRLPDAGPGVLVRSK